MIIKRWGGQGSVFEIGPGLKEYAARSMEKLTPEQRRGIREAAEEFKEHLAVEEEHDLRPGWEDELLQAGRVLSCDEERELKNKAAIQKELAARGSINFFSKNKFGSLTVVKRLKKPPSLRRS